MLSLCAKTTCGLNRNLIRPCKIESRFWFRSRVQLTRNWQKTHTDIFCPKCSIFLLEIVSTTNHKIFQHKYNTPTPTHRHTNKGGGVCTTPMVHKCPWGGPHTHIHTHSHTNEQTQSHTDSSELWDKHFLVSAVQADMRLRFLAGKWEETSCKHFLEHHLCRGVVAIDCNSLPRWRPPQHPMLQRLERMEI